MQAQADTLVLEALGVRRGAPADDVQPRLVVKANELDSLELGHLLPVLGDGPIVDLEQPPHPGGVDCHAVDLDDGHCRLLRSVIALHRL